MRILTFILLTLPFFSIAQSTETIAFYQNNFQKKMPSGSLLNCDELQELGLRLYKTTEVMKYDLVKILLYYRQQKETKFAAKGQTPLACWNSYAFHLEHYAKKHGDKKVHDIWLLNTAEREKSSCNFNFCEDPEYKNDFYVEVKGYYKKSQKYVSDDEGAVSIKYQYDEGESIGDIIEFRTFLGEKTKKAYLKEKNEEAINEIQKELNKKLFPKLENEYMLVVDLYGKKVKKAKKKKTLYKAFLYEKQHFYLNNVKNGNF